MCSRAAILHFLVLALLLNLLRYVCDLIGLPIFWVNEQDQSMIRIKRHKNCPSLSNFFVIKLNSIELTLFPKQSYEKLQIIQLKKLKN